MKATDYDIQVWDITYDILNNCKGKTIKGISVKKHLIHTGGKYRWQSGSSLHFIFDKISFTTSFIEHYEDTNDYKCKNLITESVYNVYNIIGIDKENLITFLKSKLRVIKIEKILNDNK